MIAPSLLLALWMGAFQRPGCVEISSNGRLNAGADFAQPLPGGLDLRLHADGPYGWRINVSAIGGNEDYVWIVSPPYQTAPHLFFGPVYGMTATQAAQFARDLRFVLNAADYARAFAMYEQWRSGAVTAEQLSTARSQVATGTLNLRVTEFAVRPQVNTPGGAVVEAFDWIEFTGQACVPPGGARWIP